MEPVIFASGSITFACTSDTHNDVGTEQIPDADILLHAGDMTDNGTFEELEMVYNWIAALPHKVKILIAGNHDLGLDPNHPSFSKEAHSLFTSETAQEAGIHYLNSEVRDVAYFHASDGSLQSIRVYGNPRQPGSPNSDRCFTYLPHPDPSATDAWRSAPVEPGQPDVNIWLIRSPPKDRLDHIPMPHVTGCEVQARCIARARPLLAVLGHHRSGYGVEKVTWDLLKDEAILSEMLSDQSSSREFDLSGSEMLDKDLNTLFVNTAWMPMDKKETDKRNLSWKIKINLDRGSASI